MLCRLVVNFHDMVKKEHALLNRIESSTSDEERKTLERITSKQKFSTTLLPIRTVGVQGDGRSYSYAVTISATEDDPLDWTDLAYFARIIPKVCHNINRVCYAFGGKCFGCLKLYHAPFFRSTAVVKRCPKISPKCFLFLGPIEHPVNDITQTCLTTMVISTLREVDNRANQVLKLHPVSNWLRFAQR